MINISPVKSLDNPALAPYRSLRLPAEHLRQGIFVAEGQIVVQRLLESALPIVSVLITPEWLDRYRSEIESRSDVISVFVAEKSLMETIVGFNLHQGIMALGRIPEQAELDSVIEKTPSPHLIVAVDGLTNSENLGVVVRNCAAFGVQAILVGETSSSPYLRRAVRNSMGAVFKIPVIHCKNLAETLDGLRSQKFRIFAAHPHTTNDIQNSDLSGNCCIVFGSEGSGISANVLSACDSEISIPMQLGVDSLNVACASAVFLYEVLRQRTSE